MFCQLCRCECDLHYDGAARGASEPCTIGTVLAHMQLTCVVLAGKGGEAGETAPTREAVREAPASEPLQYDLFTA